MASHAGRPKANIDWKKVGGYLQAHAEGTTIARLLGIDEATLYKRCLTDNNMNFSEYSALKKAEGVTIIEYSIFKDAAQKGGVDRIFWLKNKAGWRDQQDLKLGGSLGVEPFLQLMKEASGEDPKELKDSKLTVKVKKTSKSPNKKK
jgi:hypothetical protein